MKDVYIHPEQMFGDNNNMMDEGWKLKMNPHMTEILLVVEIMWNGGPDDSNVDIYLLHTS